MGREEARSEHEPLGAVGELERRELQAMTDQDRWDLFVEILRLARESGVTAEPDPQEPRGGSAGAG